MEKRMDRTKNFQTSDEETIKNIINNYIQAEETLIKQLYFKTSHGPVMGGFREDIWKGMFEQIIPQKFTIAQSVFIIDSEGRVSNEVDLAIYDETYTPYIFRYGRLKFIPIEAVAVVVECKSLSMDIGSLQNWVESIAVLTTSQESYTRTATRIVSGKDKSNITQTQTRPLRILCCMNKKNIEKSLTNNKMFDFVIGASSEKERLEIYYDEEKSLKNWYFALNHAGHVDNKSKDGDNNIDGSSVLDEVTLSQYQVRNQNEPVSLLSFNLQLNQLLMLINNPIPFPHIAYAKMFNKFKKGVGQDGQGPDCCAVR